jgi:hypothetical protein
MSEPSYYDPEKWGWPDYIFWGAIAGLILELTLFGLFVWGVLGK